MIGNPMDYTVFAPVLLVFIPTVGTLAVLTLILWAARRTDAAQQEFILKALSSITRVTRALFGRD